MYKCVMAPPSYDAVPISEFRATGKEQYRNPTHKSTTTKEKKRESEREKILDFLLG